MRAAHWACASGSASHRMMGQQELGLLSSLLGHLAETPDAGGQLGLLFRARASTLLPTRPPLRTPSDSSTGHQADPPSQSPVIQINPPFSSQNPFRAFHCFQFLKRGPLAFLASSLTTSWPPGVLLFLLSLSRNSPHPTSKHLLTLRCLVQEASRNP